MKKSFIAVFNVLAAVVFSAPQVDEKTEAVVNLGFNGQGKMEDVFVDYLASVDASCYIFQNLGNMGIKLCEERYEKFLRALHSRRPLVPIVIAQHCDWGSMHMAKAFSKVIAEAIKEAE